MPSAIVFPGGAVDAADRVGEEGETIRRCAVREVFEEVGLAICEPALQFNGEEEQRAWREAVHRSADQMAVLYHEKGAKVDLTSLEPLCSFITPDIEASRMKKGGFDARFFLYCLDKKSEAQRASMSADESETTALCWWTAQEALAKSEAGEIYLAPPQWLILNELARIPPMDLQQGGCWSRRGELSTVLLREQPHKPCLIAADAADQQEEALLCLALPGDEEHETIPGPSGARNRLYVHGDRIPGPCRYKLIQRLLGSVAPIPYYYHVWTHNPRFYSLFYRPLGSPRGCEIDPG